MGKRIIVRWRRDRAVTSLGDDGMCREVSESPGAAKPKTYDVLRKRKIRIVKARRELEPRQDADRAQQLADQGHHTSQIAQVTRISEERTGPEFKKSGRSQIQPRPKRHATWDIEKARDMRIQGCTWAEIGKALKVSPAIVRNNLISHGLYEPVKQPKMLWDVQEALSLWKDGLSFKEVSARLGTAEINVRKAFIRRGWLDGSTSRLTWDVKQARELREGGLSLREIAERVGTPTENLRKAFMRRGWLDSSQSRLRWDIEQARKLRKQGLSWAAVGARVGARASHVWRAFRRRGWVDEEKTPPLKWDIEEALSLWKDGLPFREVAERVGTAQVNVRKAFLRRGWLDGSTSRLTWDIKQARRLQEEGMSLKEVAAQVGTPESNLRKAFMRRGWLDGTTSRLTWDIEEARRLRKQGLSWAAIGARVGARASHVWRAFQRRGWLEDDTISLPGNSINLQWDIERARRLRESGMSWDEIGMRVGTAGKNVRDAFLRRGWLDEEEISTRSSRSINLPWDIETARRLRENGMSWDEIGVRVGTAGKNVRDAFIRRGWRREAILSYSSGERSPGHKENVSRIKLPQKS
jgi:cyanate lyase